MQKTRESTRQNSRQLVLLDFSLEAENLILVEIREHTAIDHLFRVIGSESQKATLG